MRVLRSLVAFTVLTLAPALAQAQPRAASQSPAPLTSAIAVTPPQLTLFTRLIGTWEGDASIVMGPQGRQAVHQRETVEAVAGGTAFTIKGLGTSKVADGSDRVVHDAFAVVFLDRDHVTARMRAFVALGANWIDPQFTLTADGYSWSMDDPRAGKIRYDMSFDSAGRWVETGVMSRDDGKTWTPFFEMILAKK